eukprot:CCRYP_017167-RA/>CCRYP_017167-RA protein AED:0.34 eAED:0.34 QI:0/-1/0/1/-1/1/1/0/307
MKYAIPSMDAVRGHLNASSEREQHTILNVYELPSIEQTIRYLHAAAGFPTKTTWLAAICQGNYNTWPLDTVSNVHKHFPQLEETQQGHMRSQRQGVHSTKAAPHTKPSTPSLATPSHTQHDIYIKTYDTRDTVYSDQTGKFPLTSSRGNWYQMILYHTASNSIWVGPTKNRTEGELILARTRALTQMCACGLMPQHQVLDNEASAAYKQSILDSGLTYQLVPPMTTAVMLPKNPFKLGKTTSLPYLAARPTNSHYTCGANSFLTWNGSSTSCVNLMLTPKSPLMRTSPAHTTTMHYLRSAWYGSPCP